jgi:predicted dehydrogenase
MQRREFLGTAVMGTMGLTAAARGQGLAAEGAKLKLGLIGCGWYGLVDVDAAFKVGGVELVAVCDVDRAHLEKAVAHVENKQGSKPQAFKHHQELLAMPGLQAVIIASPPHWHALQFIDALDRGLDIYCEKPLSYDLREGQAMVAAAGKAGRIVQVGFQRRQAAAIRQARDYVREGKAGRIVQVEANIHYTAGMKDAKPQPPPATLDWDLWCGPAPLIPYSPNVGHMNWRLEKEIGHGHLVDWGIHLIDATRWILGEGMPRSVTATGGLYHLKGQITTPDVLTAHFDFETCPVTWSHHIWGAAEFTPDTSNGIFFMGEKETVFVTDNRWVVIPRDGKQERRVMQTDRDAGMMHMKEFLDAVRSRQQPSCLTQDAWQSTATVQLAMVSYESATRVVWDEATKSIVDNKSAAQLLKREYRSPWKHPFSG